MALSGTINGSVTQKSSYFSFYLTWSATQNVAGNYSDVTVNTYWKTNNTYQTFDTVGSRSASITINGTTSSISKVFSVYWSSNPYLIQTATQRVYHNNDGTKSITISARANGHAASYGPSSSTASSADCTASGTITLNTIPRASSFGTISGDTIGNNMTVNISRNSSSFTHQLWYKLGDSSWYDLGTGIGTQKTFTISNDLLSQLPSATSGTLQLCLRTYNGSTQIGSDVYKNVTVYVANSVIPAVGTITLNPVDINSQNILVQGKNKLTISVSGCSAGTGSTIKSYTFSGPGISSTTTSTSVTSSGTISNTGTLTYTVKVTDNRGRTASKTATITCHAYSAPSITLGAYRVASSSSTTANNNGSCVRCTYNLSYASVNGSNKPTIKIYYKPSAATGWTSNDKATISSSTSGSSGTVNATGNYTLSSISPDSTYIVYMAITDSYGGNTSSLQVTIFGAERILNIRPAGKGIAFGKMASSDNVLDSRWPIKSDDPAGTMNNLTFRGANLISSTTNDTTANWASQGNLATTYYNASGQLNGQPGTYGFVVNVTNNAQQVHQLWMSQELTTDGKDIRHMYHRGGNKNGFGDWRMILDSTNYTNYASSKPVTLYSGVTNGTISTLSQSAANFNYLEIYYMDDYSNGRSCVRVYKPDGKTVDLSVIEASASTQTTYIRRTRYTISGKTITPNVTNSGYVHINGTTILGTYTGTNKIKIYLVLGYK